MQKGTYEGVLNIYCHDEVAKIIREQVHTLLRKSQQQFLDKRIFINVVNNHEKVRVLNYDLEFLDIVSKSDKQYGFKTTLNFVSNKYQNNHIATQLYKRHFEEAIKLYNCKTIEFHTYGNENEFSKVGIKKLDLIEIMN